MQILIAPCGNSIVLYFKLLFYFYIVQENDIKYKIHEILFQKYNYKYLGSCSFFFFFFKKRLGLFIFIQLDRVCLPGYI